MAFLFSFAAHAIIINWRYCVRLSDRKSGAPRCSFWCPEPKSMRKQARTTVHIIPKTTTILPPQTAVSTKGFPAGQRRFIHIYIYQQCTAASILHHYNVFARMVIERFLQNGLYINRHPPVWPPYVLVYLLYRRNWCFSSILRQYILYDAVVRLRSRGFHIQFHSIVYLTYRCIIMECVWGENSIIIFYVQRKLKKHTV